MRFSLIKFIKTKVEPETPNLPQINYFEEFEQNIQLATDFEMIGSFDEASKILKVC